MRILLAQHKITQLTLILVVYLLLSISCNPKRNKNNLSNVHSVDSIMNWIKLSRDKSIDINYRKELLLRAYNNNKKNKIDSVKNKNLSAIAYEAYKLKDSSLFKRANKDAFISFNRIRDTFGIADAHWNYGLFYTKSEVMDSAFYHYQKAFEHYKKLDQEIYAAKMLYNIAFVQGRIKDHTSSEISTFKAISIFKKFKKNRNLYQCYNHLGLIYNELEEYETAIFYHNKALGYLDLVENKGVYKEMVLNNLGLVYQKQGNYKKAISMFAKALSNEKIKLVKPNLYSKLIDNKAYNKFLNGDTTDLPQEFYKALAIRDSLDNVSGIVMSKLHLAEFYVKYQDTLKAIGFAKEANKLARSVNNNRDKLSALQLLSKIDIANSNTYLKEYIVLDDSLKITDRKVRNKFTRLRFETDEYIEEAQILSKKIKWIIIVSFLIISIVSLAYYAKQQQSKTKELVFEKEQQNSNEEIYTMMLRHQAKVEEGRIQERNRISEDLHDGILGKLFGIRLGFGFLNLKGDDDTIEKYNSYIKEIQQIEKEIRNISHELKSEYLSSKQDFRGIINALIKSQNKLGNLTYNVNYDDKIYWDEIDEKIKINCYRIIQEAFQNINKYAKATSVNIDFILVDNTFKLTIEDNGVGFFIKKKNKGIGLKNMRSRAQKMKGSFAINSIIDKGTKISITIPLKFINHGKNT